MGKCCVVVDFGCGKTKIAAFKMENGKPVLYSGTVTNTPENGLSDADVVQGFALQLDKLAVKKGELVVVLPVDEKNTFAAETEYPIGNSKDVGAMIRNNLTSLISEDVDQYTHSWRLIESNSSGQGRFQVAATKTASIEALYDIAEKKGLNLTRVEIAPNVLERAGILLRRDKKYGINVQGDAVAVIDVGYSSAHITVISKDKCVSTISVPHDLYRLDKIIMGSSQDLMKDPKIIPETLKLNPSFTSKISQYNDFVENVSSEIIRNIKQAIGGEHNLHLTTIYFTGGMYKSPTLVSKVKDSFGVPCFAYPMNDFMRIGDNCISFGHRCPHPTAELFTTSLGALMGGKSFE